MTMAFTVLGVAAPKGSTRAFWRPGMKFAAITHDNKRTVPWQESVVQAALDAVGKAEASTEAGTYPLLMPVEVSLTFYLPRPKTAPKRLTRQAKKPDLDKIARAILDGLTRSGVYADDGQVIHIDTWKHFAGGPHDPVGPGGLPRCVVEVRAVHDAGEAVGQRRATRPAPVEQPDLFAREGA